METPQESLRTTDGQWRAMASNIGVFEGHLSCFDRCALITSPKTPTILYVRCSSQSDVEKYLAGLFPSSIIFTLRRTNQQSDGSQTFFYGTDMSVGGRVFDSSGSMCSGAKYIAKGGSRVFIEMNLNFRLSSSTSPPSSPPTAPIAGRVRAIIIYNADGQFDSVSLFKERPRKGESDTPLVALPRHPQSVECATEEFLLPESSRVDATPRALAGAWAGRVEELGPDGLSVTSACGRIVDVTTEGLSISDVSHGSTTDRPATGDDRGEAFIALRTAVGVEHLLQLGGGVFIRAPLVIDFGAAFTSELGWLVQPDRLITVQRTYDSGAWRGSKFTDEVKSS